MKTDFWLNKWQQGDTAFNQAEVNPNLVTYFHTLTVKPGDYFFVPLCGKSVDMLWLLKQGYKVVGAELSPLACHEFFDEHKLEYKIIQHGKFECYQGHNIELLCGDFFDLNKADLPIINAVYDRAALIALPAEMRYKYVKHLETLIKQEVAILLVTIETSCSVVGPPFSVDNAEIKKLFNEGFQIASLKREQLGSIPSHLVNKGYTEIMEAVYFLQKKD